MTWFRVDDDFPTHPKTRSIPRSARRNAVGTWTLVGASTSRRLTDGRFTEEDVLDAGGTRADIRELLKAGLWHGPGQTCGHEGDACPGSPPEGFLQYHDYLVYNRSREQVLAERAAAAERQKRARGAAKAKRDESRRDSARDSRRDSARTTGVSHGPPDPKGRATPSPNISSPRSSGESSVPREPTSPAGQAVAVWSEAMRDNGIHPIADQSTVVGRQARELLDEGNDLELILDACRIAAAKGKPYIADAIGPAVKARREAAANQVSPTDPIWGQTLGRSAS